MNELNSMLPYDNLMVMLNSIMSCFYHMLVFLRSFILLSCLDKYAINQDS